MLYWEDYEVGQTASFGSYHVTREEIIEFASKYDPQPFHLSDEGAAGTHFGKLLAHRCDVHGDVGGEHEECPSRKLRLSWIGTVALEETRPCRRHASDRNRTD